MNELRQDLSLSHGTVVRIIEELCFHKVCARWVPITLSEVILTPRQL